MRTALVAGALVGLATVLPTQALAHGLVGQRQDLPIPAWLFGYAAAFVLGVSFALLSALWQKPVFQKPRGRPLFRIPRAVSTVCGLLGILWFALVVFIGLAGSPTPRANLAPTAIYVLFWVGIPVTSLFLGDVFRAFNPWRSLAVAVAFPFRGRERKLRSYPQRLGYWPVVLGTFAFAWFELGYTRETPQTLAILALVYAAIQLAGMAIYLSLIHI